MKRRYARREQKALRIGNKAIVVDKRQHSGPIPRSSPIKACVLRSRNTPHANMQQCLRCDFVNVPPHPLIYASLEPRCSPSFARRIDLHRPQAKYTIGRSPMNNFVLDDEYSGQIGESHPCTLSLSSAHKAPPDWTHCTLLLNEDGDVCIVENFTTNGIWVR